MQTHQSSTASSHQRSMSDGEAANWETEFFSTLPHSSPTGVSIHPPKMYNIVPYAEIPLPQIHTPPQHSDAPIIAMQQANSSTSPSMGSPTKLYDNHQVDIDVGNQGSTALFEPSSFKLQNHHQGYETFRLSLLHQHPNPTVSTIYSFIPPTSSQQFITIPSGNICNLIRSTSNSTTASDDDDALPDDHHSNCTDHIQCHYHHPSIMTDSNTFADQQRSVELVEQPSSPAPNGISVHENNHITNTPLNIPGAQSKRHHTSPSVRISGNQHKNYAAVLDLSKSPDSIIRGLENKIGENNCFLNVVIQSLWFMRPFRNGFLVDQPHNHSRENCIHCALTTIFSTYKYSDEYVIPPDTLRTTLANSMMNGRFQLGTIDDAAEAHVALLEFIHSSLRVADVIPDINVNTSNSNGIAQSNGFMIPEPIDSLIANNLLDSIPEESTQSIQTTLNFGLITFQDGNDDIPSKHQDFIPVAGVDRTGPIVLPMDISPNVQNNNSINDNDFPPLLAASADSSPEIRPTVGSILNNSVDDICQPPCIAHKVFALSLLEHYECHCREESEPLVYNEWIHYVSSEQLRMEHLERPFSRFDTLLRNIHVKQTKRCDNPACGKEVSVSHVLLNNPEVLTIGIAWNSNYSDKDHLQQVIDAIQEEISPHNMFFNSSPDSYVLQGMICYYGLHYITYQKLQGNWVQLDDSAIKIIGPYLSQLNQTLVTGRLQPNVLWYARKDVYAGGDKRNHWNTCKIE